MYTGLVLKRPAFSVAKCYVIVNHRPHRFSGECVLPSGGKNPGLGIEGRIQ